MKIKYTWKISHYYLHEVLKKIKKDQSSFKCHTVTFIDTVTQIYIKCCIKKILKKYQVENKGFLNISCIILATNYLASSIMEISYKKRMHNISFSQNTWSYRSSSYMSYINLYIHKKEREYVLKTMREYTYSKQGGVVRPSLVINI